MTSIIAVIHKKARAKEFFDHSYIALMNHVVKLLCKFIHKRMYKKLEKQISSSQFWLRAGVSQRSLLMNQGLLICHIDFEKAFDKGRYYILIGKFS